MFKDFADQIRWIVYRRAEKVPIDPSTGLNLDAQNPANWQSGTWCKQWADYLNQTQPGAYGVGYVIVEGCGLACIDIDKAVDNGQWSRLANEICTRFTGAYVERSQSGNGLHIFFKYQGAAPPHRKKNVALHIELYTEKRFIGITSDQIGEGSAQFDGTMLLGPLVRDYFPAPLDHDAIGWTTEPNEKWSGPEDDDELLRRAFNSTSVLSKFKGKASFRELFEADGLDRYFPPQTIGKDFDHSSADQALANHLAFWTGANCDRMDRLMQRSALKREKWEREDYYKGTIVKAAGWQKDFYNQRVEVPPSATETSVAAAPVEVVYQATVAISPDGTAVPLPPNEAPKPAPPEIGPGQVIMVNGQQEIFKGCLWVQDVNQMMVPDGRTLKREQFDADKRFARRSYMVEQGSPPVDSAWECFIQSKMAVFPQVASTVFEPREPPGDIITRDGFDYVNTWKEIDIPSAPGDARPYVDHIRKLFPNGDDAEIYTSFIAACVQYKGVKAAWALFVQGTPGNGKSFLTKVLSYCLGDIYVHAASASNLDNNFNGYLYRKLLICVEEVMTTEGKASTWEKLKTMITETRQEIEQKGIDQITREVCFNMIFNSNHKDGLRKTADDRRICPLYAAQQSVEDLERDGMTEEYFIALWDWFNAGGNAIILDYLKTYKIQGRLNFAVGARRAPRTSSTDEAISAGLGSVEQDIAEWIASGRPGFRNGWINGGSLEIALKESSRGKFLAKNKRKDCLATLGYMPHPGLTEGRVSTALTDGSRPVLYVRRDSPAVSLRDPVMIKSLYESQQRD